MPFYVRLGNVPHKRHTQFRRPDGTLYSEEVMGTRGFSGIQSILYHHWPPTQVRSARKMGEFRLDLEEMAPVGHRLLKTRAMPEGGDAVSGRFYLMANDDLRVAACRPSERMPYFYRNAEGDEVIFVHEGSGRVRTQFGSLAYGEGDYIVLPVGTTYQVEPQGPQRWLVFETTGAIDTPARYRNEYGQHLEHSPFSERDFRPPDSLETILEEGEFEVRVKGRGIITSLVMAHHPFDVVGWDGFLYPWAFNVNDFEPITGRVHQPPPVHQTFQGKNFVICSFCPRKLDYHPQAIPVPYNHSNVNSDECIYYVKGHFGSRRGVELSAITIHPSGLPHGPQPGAVEAGIGKEYTDELAVMWDTFRPMRLTRQALAWEDSAYLQSWLPQQRAGAVDTTTG